MGWPAGGPIVYTVGGLQLATSYVAAAAGGAVAAAAGGGGLLFVNSVGTIYDAAPIELNKNYLATLQLLLRLFVGTAVRSTINLPGDLERNLLRHLGFNTVEATTIDDAAKTVEEIQSFIEQFEIKLVHDPEGLSTVRRLLKCVCTISTIREYFNTTRVLGVVGPHNSGKSCLVTCS